MSRALDYPLRRIEVRRQAELLPGEIRVDNFLKSVLLKI